MHPLSEVTVIDATQALVGPFATQILGDMGAEVVKIEQPEYGDLTRHFTPEYGELSAYFVSLNRNKRSITLDLTTEDGQGVFHDLLAEADVFIQNFSPGKANEFAADHDTVSDLNEDLVYCDISGYGQNSPYNDRKAFDIVLQGESGMMSVTGTEDGEPVRVGVSICDISAAMTATYSILTALYHRERAGGGQYIDISLLDTSFQFLLYHVTNYFATGENPGRMGSKHPNLTPYQAFKTDDAYVVVGVVSEKLWPNFCEAVDHPEWIDDDRFATFEDRIRNRDEFDALLNKLFRKRTTDEWVDTLREYDVPCTPVNHVEDIVNDPHIEAHDMVAEVEHPEFGTFQMPGNPVNFSDLDVNIRRAPPGLGEHSAEILNEFGYSDDDIERLQQRNII